MLGRVSLCGGASTSAVGTDVAVPIPGAVRTMRS
jgi:hypothetical protein